MNKLANRRAATVLTATALVGTGLIGAATVADAAAQTATVTNLRTAGHSGYDRVVIDYTGKKPKVRLNWAKNLYQCASGNRLTMPGDRVLLVSLTPAQAHRNNGSNAYLGPGRSSTSTASLTTVKGVRVACDFEGQVEFGIGVTKAKSAKVTYLSGPKRVVVDIKR